MSAQLTFAIMAGGTGGHIFPGVAVAQALHHHGHEVLWLGAKGGMEERIVRQHGIPLTAISMQALRGKGFAKLLSMPFRLLKGIWQSRRFFVKNKVDVAISLGGFVAAPGGFATHFCRTKLVVHEQNSIFGMTNRHLAKRADLVLTGFDLDGLYGSQWIGNPVRQSIAELPIKQATDKSPLKVLVLGGSLGAECLNLTLPEVLTPYLQRAEIEVRHQCGRGKKAGTEAAYGSTSVAVSEFIQDMAKAYAWADLCVCRAGALTVAEVTAASLPALFVPYPYAVDNHQTHNALKLVEQDAALLWQESEGKQTLQQLFSKLMEKSSRANMIKQLQPFKKPQVAEQIAAKCEEVMA